MVRQTVLLRELLMAMRWVPLMVRLWATQTEMWSAWPTEQPTEQQMATLLVSLWEQRLVKQSV